MSWAGWEKAVADQDPHCRGVLLLGRDAPLSDVKDAVTRAGGQGLCKGFAIGRTIFGPAAKAWFAGDMTDEAARAAMADTLDAVIAAWPR